MGQPFQEKVDLISSSISAAGLTAKKTNQLSSCKVRNKQIPERASPRRTNSERNLNLFEDLLLSVQNNVLFLTVEHIEFRDSRLRSSECVLYATTDIRVFVSLYVSLCYVPLSLSLSLEDLRL